jgi:hypothetical protein
MESQRETPEHGSDTIGQIRERLVRVERDLHHEARHCRDEIGTLKLRLLDLEREMEQGQVIHLPSVSAGTKLLLALLLPLAIYLLTGSIEKALTAAAVMGAG